MGRLFDIGSDDISFDGGSDDRFCVGRYPILAVGCNEDIINTAETALNYRQSIKTESILLFYAKIAYKFTIHSIGLYRMLDSFQTTTPIN